MIAKTGLILAVFAAAAVFSTDILFSLVLVIARVRVEIHGIILILTGDIIIIATTAPEVPTPRIAIGKILSRDRSRHIGTQLLITPPEEERP